MRTRDTLPINWMIGTIVFLALIVHGMQRTERMMALSAASHVSSPVSFFQFLANMVEFGNIDTASNGSSIKNNTANKNGPGSGQSGGFNSGNQQNPNSASTQTDSVSQGGKNTENNPSGNSGASADQKTGDLSDSASDSDSKIDSEINSTDSSEYNAESNSENNPETNADNNSGSNPTNNSEINPTNSTADNSETNAENSPGNNPVDNPGNNPVDNPGNSPGNNPGNSPGNNPGFLNPSDFPTINPIPSDSTVSQSVSEQNQQSDSKAALIASREALVAPVQQQAQDTKFQTVNTQTLQPPSTNQPPADVAAKAQAKQITFH